MPVWRVAGYEFRIGVLVDRPITVLMLYRTYVCWDFTTYSGSSSGHPQTGRVYRRRGKVLGNGPGGLAAACSAHSCVTGLEGKPDLTSWTLMCKCLPVYGYGLTTCRFVSHACSSMRRPPVCCSCEELAKKSESVLLIAHSIGWHITQVWVLP